MKMTQFPSSLFFLVVAALIAAFSAEVACLVACAHGFSLPVWLPEAIRELGK